MLFPRFKRPLSATTKLQRLRKSTRRSADVNAALVAYSNWRAQCGEVRTAYRAWVRAAPEQASLAFASYRLAVDREELAAEAYAERLRSTRLPEVGLATQLAGSQ